MVGNVGESWFRVVVADAGLFSVENESFVSHGAEVMPVYLPEWHVGNTGGYYFYPIVFPLLFTHAGNGLARGGGELWCFQRGSCWGGSRSVFPEPVGGIRR
mgnify:CR=1 FL=1